MTDKELEIELSNRCLSLDLKKKAFSNLEKIISDPENNEEKDFLCGFERSEITFVFDRFTYQVGRAD